jgi:hypothetical protein
MKRIIVVILMLAVVAAPGYAQDEMTWKENLDYYLGNWETEYEYPGYGQMREEVEYTPGEDEFTINISFKVFAEGEQIDQGTGWIKYDPEEEIVHSSVTSEVENTLITSRQVKHEGNVTWMEGEGGEMMPEFRIKITIVDEDRYDWKMYVPQGEDWSEIMEVTYYRVEK